MSPIVPHEVLVVEPDGELRKLLATDITELAHSKATCVASLEEARVRLKAGEIPCVAFVQIEAPGKAYRAEPSSLKQDLGLSCAIVALSYGRAVDASDEVISLDAPGSFDRVVGEIRARCTTPAHASRPVALN